MPPETVAVKEMGLPGVMVEGLKVKVDVRADVIVTCWVLVAMF